MVKKVVALIPARAGSVRVKDKNIYNLAGRPLLTIAVERALQSQVFTQIIVSTDSDKYATILKEFFPSKVTILKRPGNLAVSTSPDIEWVSHAVEALNLHQVADAAAILRVTSPLRTVKSIIECWEKFCEHGKNADSIRAVVAVDKHPGKMWALAGETMVPLLPFQHRNGVPWHSSQSCTLPTIFAQTASMEMFWLASFQSKKSISGDVVLPFITSGLETLDINSPEDIAYLEYLISSKKDLL